MKNIYRLVLLFLCLSALAGAQAGVTLLVKSDVDCNWKLDGHPMNLLKADNSRVVPVSPGEHFIRAATTDGVTKIRIEAEIDQGQKMVKIQLKDEHDQELKRRQEETIRKQAEAERALHPTWTDPDTKLTWAKKDNGSDTSWEQASDYCTKLQLAGYNDWRLPTIEELHGIYDSSVSIRTMFDPGYVDVRVKGNLKLTGWDWSSSSGKVSGTALVYNFALSGQQELVPFPAGGLSYSMRALCVRSSGE
jgi:hypothetical protein